MIFIKNQAFFSLMARYLIYFKPYNFIQNNGHVPKSPSARLVLSLSKGTGLTIIVKEAFAFLRKKGLSKTRNLAHRIPMRWEGVNLLGFSRLPAHGTRRPDN
jgi:hypothetical protein